jgi:probable HAF family extracellular repeat protein
MKKLFIIPLAVSLLLIFSQYLQADVRYAVTEIGSFGGTYTGVSSINDNGEVVGWSWSPGNSWYHPYLYDKGTMTDLGTLNGVGRPYDMNNNGQVVGFSDIAYQHQHAFVYNKGGTMVDLNNLINPNPGVELIEADEINDNGYIIANGWVGDDHSTCHGFLYHDGTVKDIGGLGISGCVAEAINASGQIAGISRINSGMHHGFIYDNGAMKDIGTLGGSFLTVNAINDLGQVVGDSSTGVEGQHAFLYNGENMIDLGTFGGTLSWASDINNSGQVVGSAYYASNVSHAFIYSNGTMTDLNDLIPSGWELTSATAINNLGQITGTGYHNGKDCPFLLTPVPEPSTIALLLTATIGGLLWWRRR